MEKIILIVKIPQNYDRNKFREPRKYENTFQNINEINATAM